MNAAANYPTDFDIEFLRSQIRRCLRARMPSQGSTLGDMQTRHAKGEQLLKAPQSVYWVEELQEDGTYKSVAKRKPSHDQWATTTHATATRAPGFSRETITERDYSKAKYVRAIGSLSANQIQSIQARYSPNRSMRHGARQRLCSAVSRAYRVPETKLRSMVIAMAVLTDRDSAAYLQDQLSMTPKEWDASRARRMLTDIRTKLTHLDFDSLLDWDAECIRLDQGVD